MDCRVKTISPRVDAAPGHGGAVLLGVDVRILAIASQIVQPRDVSLKTSFRIDDPSYDILNFPVHRAGTRTTHRPAATFRATRALHPKGCRHRRRRARPGHETQLVKQGSHHLTNLTTVELLWLKKRIENRIRFGHPVAERVIDPHRRVVSFAPGSMFAFVRWTSSDFGTELSRIDILCAASPEQRYSTVPCVNPGGVILLRLSGWSKVERVLQFIDAVEALGIDPTDAAPDYWHHVHNRLSVAETPRSYSRTRHQAWLNRRKVSP